MSCDNCITMCSVYPQIPIKLLKATAATSYVLEITKLGSNKTYTFDVTADGSGLIELNESIEDFLNSDSQFRVRLYYNDLNNITSPKTRVNFNVFTAVASNGTVTPSVSTYNCLLFSTIIGYDIDNELALNNLNQYLINADA